MRGGDECLGCKRKHHLWICAIAVGEAYLNHLSMNRELNALHARVKVCGEGNRYKRMARITRDKDTLDTVRIDLSDVLRRYSVRCVGPTTWLRSRIP